jgi:hypothetical protein
MSDLVVVAAALFGVALAAGGLGWLHPGLRARLAGERVGTDAGAVPGIVLIGAGLLLATIALGGFTG